MIFIFISNTSIDIFFSFFRSFFFSTVAAAAAALPFSSVSCYFYAFEIFGSLLAVDFIGINATNENRHKCTNCIHTHTHNTQRCLNNFAFFSSVSLHLFTFRPVSLCQFFLFFCSLFWLPTHSLTHSLVTYQ